MLAEFNPYGCRTEIWVVHPPPQLRLSVMSMLTVSQYLLPSRDPSQPGSSGTSLVVQWLRLCTSTAGGGGGTSSNPGWGTKIPHGMQCGQNLKSQKKRNPNIPPKLTPSRPTGESAGTGAYIITGRRSSHLYSMSVILKGRDYM